MWLMTTRGFFSVVEHREDDNLLLIRARCKQDIDALAELVPATPISILDADYAWRIEATRAQWAEALLALLAEVTYPTSRTRFETAIITTLILVSGASCSSLTTADDRCAVGSPSLAAGDVFTIN